MRAMTHETGTLLDKKRLGKNQKARLATLIDKLDAAKQPPPTPPCPNTGERGDFQGNVYAQHYRTSVTAREMRRGSKFGLAQCRPMRSRIQRSARKRRTGGVK
jgi:hypothetical protein